jgi:gliding motility-associated lipoprotein GldH
LIFSTVHSLTLRDASPGRASLLFRCRNKDNKGLGFRFGWLWALAFFSVIIFTSCDTSRVYDKNTDFADRYWTTEEKPEFEFQINEPEDEYDLFANVRNTASYPNANLYFTYYLTDSTGRVLEKKLMSEFLFDRKTGKPIGSSVLGDIYDHRFLLLKNYKFDLPGKYKVRYEQFMRTDTLRGMLAIGLRVESK